MLKVRRRVDVMEAERYHAVGQDWPPHWPVEAWHYVDGLLLFPTPAGVTCAGPGDFVIRGRHGDFFSYTAELFEQLYEVVE